MIPYGKQTITDDDIESVIAVLKSDFLTQGPTVELFEQAICQYTQSEYSVAVNSATSALHISCLALDLTKGDIAWTSPISFVASANCVLYCGAKIDFVDIDPDTYNLSIDALTEKLRHSKKHNCLPKIIIPVHLSGQSCDMEAIYELSLEYGFKIIEDASHAIGGKYQNKPIGNGAYSDITVFSFHPVKIMTSGEGGIAITNNNNLAQKLTLLRGHGIIRTPQKMLGDIDGPWVYQQQALGFNYRMSDIHAALGLSQLKKVDHSIQQRCHLVKVYHNELKDLPVTLPQVHADSEPSHHLYIITINSNAKIDRLSVYNECIKHGIGVNVHYIPIHLQPYYQQLGFKKNDFPNAEAYYETALTLPIYPALKGEEQQAIIATLKNLLS